MVIWQEYLTFELLVLETDFCVSTVRVLVLLKKLCLIQNLAVLVRVSKSISVVALNTVLFETRTRDVVFRGRQGLEPGGACFILGQGMQHSRVAA